MGLSSERLEELARGPITYEVVTMTDQVRVLLDSYTPSGGGSPEYRALIEAALVHLRLLDDFFGMPPKYRRDDVLACDYLSTWGPARFLDGAERRDMNAQLAHLLSRRREDYLWDFGDLASRCVWTVLEFTEQLAADDPSRARWFGNAAEACRAAEGAGLTEGWLLGS